MIAPVNDSTALRDSRVYNLQRLIFQMSQPGSREETLVHIDTGNLSYSEVLNALPPTSLLYQAGLGAPSPSGESTFSTIIIIA